MGRWAYSSDSPPRQPRRRRNSGPRGTGRRHLHSSRDAVVDPVGTVNPGMPSNATASIGLCAVENLAEHLWTLLVIVDGKWPLPGRRCDEDRGAGTTATPAGSGRGDRTPRKGAQVELQCHAEPGPIAVLTFWSPNCSICWASRTGASVITNGTTALSRKWGGAACSTW